MPCICSLPMVYLLAILWKFTTRAWLYNITYIYKHTFIPIKVMVFWCFYEFFLKCNRYVLSSEDDLPAWWTLLEGYVLILARSYFFMLHASLISRYNATYMSTALSYPRVNMISLSLRSVVNDESVNHNQNTTHDKDQHSTVWHVTILLLCTVQHWNNCAIENSNIVHWTSLFRVCISPHFISTTFKIYSSMIKMFC